MTDLIDTTEMYLRTILELEEEGIPPLRARIVERLEHSGPTVSQTVGRMERDGLVHVGDDRRLQLTEQGRELAVSVLRKHRLAERLLADVIGLDWAYVHDEACRWEHVMSDRVEQRLLEILDDPATTPYGTPIPPRPDKATAAEWSASMGLSERSLLDAVREADHGRVRVSSLAEAVQADAELLEELFRAHVRPGVLLDVRETADAGYLRVQAVDVEDAPALELGRESAAHVRVAEGG